MIPLLSVIIPGFNRPGPLKATLRSVADAAARLSPGAIEVILVDDGSTPPLSEQLAGFDAGIVVAIHRQANAGSIVARQHGLGVATGEFVQFLDSDDLVHPEKFAVQLAAQRAAGADVSYTDMSEAEPGADHRAREFRPTSVLRLATEPADFYLRVQPLPHSPIYRRDYLRPLLLPPRILPQRAMDAAGDVWMFYNLAAAPGRIIKVDGPFAAVGVHHEERFSRCWEGLALSALLIAEAFIRTTPADDATLAARQTVGEVAFDSWRRLPWDFCPEFQARLLSIWRQSPRRPGARLGGRGFMAFARVVGPVAAARFLRRRRGARYASCRTLPAGEFERRLAATLPS